MILVHSLLSGICVVISATGLLTKPLKREQNAILVLYVSAMAFIAIKYCSTIQIFGISMIVFLLALIYYMVTEYRVLNVFFSCVGYLVNITCNNSILLFCAKIFHIPTKVMERDYYVLFSVIYIFLLKGILSVTRKILYSKMKVHEKLKNMSKITQYCLAVNVALYATIFLINVSMGESIGYSTAALVFNTILFIICLIVNCIMVIECTKGIETEEKRKAQLHQQQILENYVGNLESMVDEMRAFKHDYKNILSTMAGYLRESQIEELRKFFYEKTQLPRGNSESRGEAWKYLKDIEPMELKGFLYEKFLLAMARDIEIKVDISHNLNVRYEAMEDLVRVLGIFIDNAIEATEILKNGMMDIIIAKTENGVLFCIKNNYEEEPNLSMITQNGYSTKGSGRGMGLYWAEKIIREHRDMFHETGLSEQCFVQTLEVSI